jgi:MFS family permease
VFANKNAMLLVLCFGFIFGTVNTYGTVIGIMTKPLGYTDSDASLFGTFFIIGSLIGSGVLGAYVEITKNYKRAMIIICTIAIITPLLMMWTFTTN